MNLPLLFLSSYSEFNKFIEHQEYYTLSCVNKLWNRVVKAGSIPALLKQPNRDFSSALAPFFLKYFPYINECQCPRAPEYLRDSLTENLIHSLGQVSKSQVVQSVGCGGCLRELIFSIHLYEAGVTHLHLVLVDPSNAANLTNWIHPLRTRRYKKADLHETAKCLQLFMLLFLPKLQVRIDYCKGTTEDYIKRTWVPNPDIVLMVDIDFFDILKRSFQDLKDNGVLNPHTQLGLTRTVVSENGYVVPKGFVGSACEIEAIVNEVKNSPDNQ